MKKVLIPLVIFVLAMLFGTAANQRSAADQFFTAVNQFSETAQAATASPSVSPSPQASPLASTQPSSELYPVASVTDGDTFKVMIDGKKMTVRIVGINTPETVDPRRSVECFGKEASDKLKSVLTGKSVKLEADATQGDTDKYGRLLRFVFLEDGTDVGKKMILEGYAHEELYSKVPHKYRDEYLAAQAEAQRVQAGLWGAGVCEGK